MDAALQHAYPNAVERLEILVGQVGVVGLCVQDGVAYPRFELGEGETRLPLRGAFHGAEQIDFAPFEHGKAFGP